MQITDICSSADGARATLLWHGTRATLEVPLSGHHNVHNAAMALAAALVAGVPMDQTLAALATFPGVARRMEVVGEACGVIIVDDFAHHPTAVAATIAACRDRWPDRRLVVAFEPRSLTAARRMFQDQYAEALAGADVVVVAAPFHRDRLPPEDLIDRDALAQVLLRQGVVAIMPVEGEDPVAQVAALAAPGDLVVGCSSGSFDAFHRRLLKQLTDRSDPS